MAEGILQRLPDLSVLQQAGTTTTRDVNAMIGNLNSLESGQEGSPLTAIARLLGELDRKLDIDVSAIATDLPNTINVVKNTLPEGTVEQIEAIEEAYRAAQDFLQDSVLAQQVQEGTTLQAVALAVVAEALSLFNRRFTELAENLIRTEDLDQVRTLFASLEQFQTDFPTHQADFLPFITRNLLGVAPDLLRQPLDQLDALYSVLAPLEPEALATALAAPQQAIATIVNDLVTAIASLDPTDADSYRQIQTHLDAADTAIRDLLAALSSLYQQVDSAIASYNWETVFSTYQSLLSAIAIEPIFSVDETIDSIASVLDEILARLYMTLGVEDLTQRVGELSRVIRDTFTHSGLGQIRQTLRNFLEQIQGAIAAVPTEAIQALVETMLAQVRQALENLGITQITAEIEQAFAALETFVTENINDTLVNNVRTALAPVLSQVRSLPIDNLIAVLSQGIGELDNLIAELETALQGYMAEFTQFAARLDELSFKPIGDEVIGEINELKARLQAINPNALSDAEKLALKAALAVLESIDLEGQVVFGLNQGFDALQGQVKGLLSEITAALNRLREQLGDFNPQVILQPVCDLLDQATELVNRLNGRLLMQPLSEQVEQLAKRLEVLAPGRLLDPLQAPYNEMLQVVNRLDPNEWVAPLNSLYEQIDRLIFAIDITPLLEELDRQQKQLFADARGALLNALGSLNLPEPLNSFWDGLRLVLEGLTDAIFGNPDTELRRISLELKAQFKLTSLFEPLDRVFNRLIEMLESIPQDSLTETMNAIRQSLGVGLEVLNPSIILRRFRQGQGQLVELTPAVQLSNALKLPNLKQYFQFQVETAPPEQSGNIATVLVRFDTVFALLNPDLAQSQFNQLIQTHDRLVNTLRSRINHFDLAAVEIAYAKLRDSLVQVLPDFLRQPTSLTYSEILTGIYALRPSTKIGRIDQTLERFLQQLEPLESALEPAVNEFFTTIRETVMLINPLSLKDAVEDIYDTIRAKVRILDPQALATSIRTNLFDPLREPLDAINPVAIRDKINGAFERAIAALSSGVTTILDDIIEVLDQQLEAIRTEIQTLIHQIKAAIQIVAQSLQDIVNQVERLVFVEVLERLHRVIDNLGVSFEQELNRVRNAFDAMLAAIPLSASTSESISL